MYSRARNLDLEIKRSQLQDQVLTTMGRRIIGTRGHTTSYLLIYDFVSHLVIIIVIISPLLFLFAGVTLSRLFEEGLVCEVVLSLH